MLGTTLHKHPRQLHLEPQKNHSLLPHKRRVLVRRIAIHPIIHDLARLRDSIAPERLRLDPEIPHDPTRDVAQRERNRAPVAVLARAVREVRPPGLAVAVDAARGVSIDGEVVAGDDEPGGLVLRK